MKTLTEIKLSLFLLHIDTCIISLCQDHKIKEIKKNVSIQIIKGLKSRLKSLVKKVQKKVIFSGRNFLPKESVSNRIYRFPKPVRVPS